MSAEGRIGSFAEAWPYYLREHRQPGTRLMHLVGSTLFLLLLVAAEVSGRPALLLGALLAGYGFAWMSHFLIERNRARHLPLPVLVVRCGLGAVGARARGAAPARAPPRRSLNGDATHRGGRGEPAASVVAPAVTGGRPLSGRPAAILRTGDCSGMAAPRRLT